MGRPSKLTPERQEAILGFIRAGVPNVRAAQLSGISERTFYNWLERAEPEEGEEPEKEYLQFLQAIKEAESGFIESNLGVIRRAASEPSVTKREHIRGRRRRDQGNHQRAVEVVCGPARSPSICDGWNSRDGTDSKTTATPHQNHITQELTPRAHHGLMRR